MATEGYPQHARSTGNRLKNRIKYDFETVHNIVDSTPILHVSFPPTGDDPFPIVLPMLGCTGNFEDYQAKGKDNNEEFVTPGSFPTGDQKQTLHQLPDGPRVVYLHGHAAARLFKTAEDGRIPVTIGVSAMQGIVLALTPFHNSCNYTSAVIHGYASNITDEAERSYALTIITDNLVPERWDNSRVPPTKAELTSTGVLKVEIESASAKVRVGGPGDDRADLKNEDLLNRVWTGVIPCWTHFGTPQESSYNQVKRLPGYVKDFVETQNQAGEKQASEAIAQTAPKK